MRENDDESSHITDPKDHIALIPAMAMLERACEFFAEYDLGYKDALTLVEDTYIRAITRRYPDASIRELTQGEDPPLEMSRRTVSNVRRRAREIYKDLYTPQIKAAIRRVSDPCVKTNDGADAFSGKTKSQLRHLIQATPAFERLDPDDLLALFDTAFEELIEDEEDTGLMSSGKEDRWLPRANLVYATTEMIDEARRNLGADIGDTTDDPGVSAKLAALEQANVVLAGEVTGRVMHMLTDVLEACFFNAPHRLPNTGIQTLRFSIKPSSVAKLDRLWWGTIMPLIELLNNEADYYHALERDTDQGPLHTAQVSFMWTHDIFEARHGVKGRSLPATP